LPSQSSSYFKPLVLSKVAQPEAAPQSHSAPKPAATPRPKLDPRRFLALASGPLSAAQPMRSAALGCTHAPGSVGSSSAACESRAALRELSRGCGLPVH
jgi:hypothetical protein